MSSETSTIDIHWVIESKFQPNRPRMKLVRRDRLLAQLNGAIEKKLALIVAPAGYGKSSLLGQWVEGAEEENIRYAWLTLEGDEADAKQFLAYIVLALARAGLEFDDLVTGARDGFSDAAIGAVLSKLIRQLNEEKARIVLILEDYHNAECDAVNDIVKRLIRDTLSSFTTFIDSRRSPNIEAFSLIASGDAIEIGAAQLRLTQDETITALEGIADKSSGLEIYEKTEGWPVAVQLALVQKRAQPSAPLLAGVDGGLVAAYLTEQILSTLDEQSQELLLAIAFLERFNPELTNYVLDSPEAWGRINSLSSFAALIVPLDPEGRWYRLHHLFAEYLREMQTRRDQALAKQILLRASQWYDDRNQLVDAVRYAAGASEYAECARLILEAGGWKIILNDGIGVLRNSLRILPDGVISSSDRLLVARAYLYCKYGEIQEARATLDAAAHLPQEKSPEIGYTDRLVVESMINLYEDRAVWTEEHSRIRQGFSDDDSLGPLGQGTMKCEEVLIHLSRAEFDQAADRLRSAFALMRLSGSVLGLNYCYIHAGHLALHRGDMATAAANIDRASQMADENFGSDSGLKAISSVLNFALRVYQGECTAQDLEPLRDALFHTLDNDGWVDLYITGLHAAMHLAQQCSSEEYSHEILEKILVFSDQRNLPRLRDFAVLYTHPVRDERGSAAPSAGMLSQGNLQFPAGYTGESDARNWQSFLHSTCMSDLTQYDGRSSASFDQAISFADAHGAGTWRLMLSLAKVRFLLANDATERAKGDLFESVKTAIPNQLYGLFLGDKKIMDLLAELKSELRHKEQELISVQFIDELFRRAKVLNPQKNSRLLSEREYDVLEKLAQGLSNKEIARALELTENTVKFHLKSLFAKLSVHKRTQAVVEAQRRGLIK